MEALVSSGVPGSGEGERLVGGRYSLLEPVGSGGSGSVWRAYDRRLDREVAVKQIAMPGEESNTRRQRARREAQAAGRLSHQNIVAVHDVLEQDGDLWIVMQFVPGTSLQQLLSEKGTIPAWYAATIGIQVLHGLMDAHERGILHRDIKPSNIRIDPQGKVVLTDFGIAQIQGADELTAAGLVVGSPGYIPPERFQGESITPAADLWSLGATLYTAVEGRPPFARETLPSTISATLLEPVPRPHRAGALTPVLLGLLNRTPADRMTAEDAETRLEDIARARPGLGMVPLEIDGLQIQELLGGTVWAAEYEGSGQRVAVRLLLADEHRVVEAAIKVQRAAPEGVVQVLGIGNLETGDRYIVTQLVEPGSLAWRPPAPVAEDVTLITQVARRMAAVNAQGIRYGSLRPGQVLLDGEDEFLLGLPEPEEEGSELAAVGRFAAGLLGERAPAPVTEVIGKAIGGEWPDLEAFATALDSLPLAQPPAADAEEEPPADILAPPSGDPQPYPPPTSGRPDPGPDDPQAGGPGSRRVPTGAFPVPPGAADPDQRGYAPPPAGPYTYQPGYPSPPSEATLDFGTPPADAGQHGAPPPQQPYTGPIPYSPPDDSARPRRRRWRRTRTPEPEHPQADVSAPPPGTFSTTLIEPFRYVHEPLSTEDTGIPLLGNEALIQRLKERLANSHGGTFLVTGFRGVGKTTLVERAMVEIAAEHPRGRRVLPVILSVARPMAVDKLLFAIVRRVFEELTEAGVLDDLPAATRQSLLLAYMRTSLSFKETRSDAVERTHNIDIDPTKVLKPLGGMIPKAGISTKRSRSLATEAAFLAYSETDVEHDMMRIVRMLSAPYRGPVSRWRRLLRRRARPLDLQLIIVLDEVDKLTALKDGLEEVERLLGGIKNVVTMRGAHYLVVAGPDLYDQVLKDSGRGNSIYESIFAWRLYVPCSWTAPGRLLKNILADPPAGAYGAYGVVEDFEHYLRFRSRGVLRRLLHEVNSYVVWNAGKPYLRIDPRQHDAIAFYARIERSLDEFFYATRHEVLPSPIDQDRWRLSAYYVVDWILRGAGRPFTSADIMQAVQNLDFDPLLHVSQTGVDMLLGHLAARQILEVLRRPDEATSTFIADVAEAQRSSYKLADAMVAKLRGIVMHNEGERAELEYGAAPLAAEVLGRGVPIQTLVNRYELLRLVGEGGTSSVYEGRDLLVHRPVAVKMLRTSLRGDPRARGRFLREAHIAEGTHHPNVVDVYEVVTLAGPDEDAAEPDYAIVMEYVAAPTLRQTLQRRGRIPAGEVVEMAIVLARALDYLWGKGLARIDLKPHNIVMSPGRGPVIIDLGIAKIVKDAQAWLIATDDEQAGGDPQTQTGIMIGTPAYLAPEQVGNEPVDIRADIYALGLVMYTCLAGRHPYEGLDLAAIFTRIMDTDLDTSDLPCSPPLREVIARAAARTPATRYPDPAALLAALHSTPEAQDL